MSVAQDFRSVFRGSKAFEVKNVDAVTLAAFTPVEIDEAESIESDNRTIVHVKRPTSASLDPDMMCILGPMDIASGKYGVATADYPAYARYTGGPPVNGEVWGTTLSGTDLASGQTGFKIWGDATGSVVKVHPALGSSTDTGSTILRAELSAEMCSTDLTGSITNVEFMSTWLGSTPTTAENVFGLAGAVGDLIHAVYRSLTDEWEIFEITHVRTEFLEKMIEPSEVTAGELPSLDAGEILQDPGCDYKFRRLATPMVRDPISQGCVVEAFDEINFRPQIVINDLACQVDQEGVIDCIRARVGVVWVPDQCDEIAPEWVDIDTCCPPGGTGTTGTGTGTGTGGGGSGTGNPENPCGDCLWEWSVPNGPWILAIDNCIYADCVCAEPTFEPSNPNSAASVMVDCTRNP